MLSVRTHRHCKIFNRQIFNYVLYVLFTKAGKQTLKKRISIIRIGFSFRHCTLLVAFVHWSNLESRQQGIQTMPWTSRKCWTFAFGWPRNRITFNHSTISSHSLAVLHLSIHLLLCALSFNMGQWTWMVIEFAVLLLILFMPFKHSVTNRMFGSFKIRMLRS